VQVAWKEGRKLGAEELFVKWILAPQLLKGASGYSQPKVGCKNFSFNSQPLPGNRY
jgi:hypothetical protein